VERQLLVPQLAEQLVPLVLLVLLALLVALDQQLV
jgi:hypothetical protein